MLLGGMRRVLSLVLAVCFVAPLMSTSVGRAQDTDAEKAAKEIVDARDRANAAADAYFASESRIDDLTVQEGQLQSEVTALEGDVKALKLSVENVAIGRYTRQEAPVYRCSPASSLPKTRSRSTRFSK